MKRILCFLAILPFFASSMQAEEASRTKKSHLPSSLIKKELWFTDYQAALKAAKERKCPLLMVFLGNQWCPWSEKLQEEVLHQPAFLNSLQQDMVFLKITLPEYPEESKEYLESKRIQDKFSVRECPLFVMISPQEKEISKISYLPLGPEEYGSSIKELLFDYRIIEMVMHQKKLKSLDFEELKTLYQKSSRFTNSFYAEKILEQGLKKDQGAFFSLEQYSHLMLQESASKEEKRTLKNHILARDPQNQHGTYLKIAMVDFEVLAHQSKKMVKPQKAIKPLVEYLQKFGQQDTENKWKVEMALSQYLFSKNLLKEAMQHAEASFDAAPENMKPELLESLNYIKSHLANHDSK